MSSDRQDVDLSVAAQLRALRDYARANGYSVAREYIDEAESGRVADRPEFRKMIEEGSQPNSPFREILVWKFSPLHQKAGTRRRLQVHAQAQGCQGRLHHRARRRLPHRQAHGGHHRERGPNFYSENLAQEVVRGMREAASRGFFLGSKAPFGYIRVKVSDGAKERPTLEIDPATAPVVREIFESSLRGNGLKEICKALNDRGVTNRGKRWYKGGLHYLLTNEALHRRRHLGQNQQGRARHRPR